MAGRILIVDAVATNRILLKVKLAEACHGVGQAATAAAALRQARAQAPDLVLIDGALPDADTVDTCRALRGLPGLSALPILMLDGSADPARRLQALSAGVAEVLDKPPEEPLLMAWIRSLLRARARAREMQPPVPAAGLPGLAEAPAAAWEAPGRIALVAAAPAAQGGWSGLAAALAPHNCRRHEARTALLEMSAQSPPDVVLIDAGDAAPAALFRLISELRTQAASRHAALMLRMGRGGGAPADTAAQALDMGVDDLLPPGADARECALRAVRQLAAKRRADRCRLALRDGARLSVIDPLTGLFNRRLAMRRGDEIAAASIASGRRFAALMLDIDRFKRINDRHGHAAGDAALQQVARRMRGVMRSGDLLARIGGEEFLAILPETRLEQAQALAERLRRAVASRPVTLPNGAGEITVTLSIGLAAGGPPDPRDLAAALAIERADRALLAAKAEGRNQINVGRTAA